MDMTLFWLTALLVLVLCTVLFPNSSLFLLPILIVFSPEFSFFDSFVPSFYIRPGDLIACVLLFHILRRKEIKLKKVWIVAAIYTLVSILSTILGIAAETVHSSALSIFYIAKIIEYFVVGVGVSTIAEGRRVEHFFAFGFSVSMSLALIAAPFVFDPERTRLPFTGIQETAVIAAIAIVFFTSLLADSTHRATVKMKSLYFVALVSGLFYLFTSAGRAGILGLGAGLLYVIFQHLNIKSIIATFCFVILSIFLILTADITAINHLEYTARAVLNLNLKQLHSLVARLSLWETGIQLWIDHPVLGNGIPTLSYWLDGWYVRILVETGLVGLIVWGWLMLKVYQCVIHSNISRGYQTGVVSVLLVMSVSSIFGARFLTANTAMMFWVVVGTATHIPKYNNNVE